MCVKCAKMINLVIYHLLIAKIFDGDFISTYVSIDCTDLNFSLPWYTYQIDVVMFLINFCVVIQDVLYCMCAN